MMQGRYFVIAEKPEETWNDKCTVRTKYKQKSSELYSLSTLPNSVNRCLMVYCFIVVLLT